MEIDSLESRSDDDLNKDKCSIPAPFSQRLKAPKKLVQNADILENFKQVKINISFSNDIQQIHLMQISWKIYVL